MARLQPPLEVRSIQTPQICDICGQKRSIGNHRKCSRIRQQLNAHKWIEHEQAKLERAAK